VHGLSRRVGDEGDASDGVAQPVDAKVMTRLAVSLDPRVDLATAHSPRKKRIHGKAEERNHFSFMNKSFNT